MTWSERRKLTYTFFTLSVIALIAGGFVYRATNVPPTCADGRENGTEIGVDCGGICSNYCPYQLPDPKVRWYRTFPVTNSIVHAVAYIEHGNVAAAARNAEYSFKLYDERNTLITERKGSTFIGPMGRSAIVDTLIPIGNTPVARVQFEFTKVIPWEKIPNEFSTVAIKSDRTTLEKLPSSARLTATLENQSRYNFVNMEAVAILYDADGNAVAVSKALVPELDGLSSKQVYFTWLYAVPNAVRVEVFPRFNPFTASVL